MKLFLGIGECMVELSPAGDGLWRQGFAGDVLNTLWYARAALTEDWEVAFHSAVGADPISGEMLDFIESAGIRCTDMPRIPGRMPGLYSIHLDDGERSFNYWRDTSAARSMMDYADDLFERAASADVVYLSGITLAILPDADARTLLTGLAARMKPGSILGFDPNIRPKLWDDADRMREVISLAGSVSQIVLPSFDDEADAFGDASPEATADRYLSLGAELAIVKDGSNPTRAVTPQGAEVFPVTPAAQVVDTTAAGDSFAGAFLASYATTGSVATAVRAAQDCAAAVVSHPGGLVPFDVLKPAG